MSLLIGWIRARVDDYYMTILYGVFIFAVYFILRAVIESVSNG